MPSPTQAQVEQLKAQGCSAADWSKVSFDAHQLASAASGAITNAIRSTLTIVVSFGYLMWLNWKLTLPALPRLPPFLLNRLRTLATVRTGLSVAVSTSTAMPCGA